MITGPSLEQVAAPANLLDAWQAVLGSADIGHVPLSEDVRAFRDDALARLDRLQRELLAGTWRPGAALGGGSGDGGKRAFKVACVADRVVQMALAEAIGRSMDPCMPAGCFGHRKGQGVSEAVNSLRDGMSAGWPQVARTGVAEPFDNVPRMLAARALGEWVQDPRCLNLVIMMLARLDEQGIEGRGIPETSPLSPLLLHVILCAVDKALDAQGFVHVRYGEEFAVLTRDHGQSLAALDLIGGELARLGMAVDQARTQEQPTAAGVDFLGQRIPPQGRPMASDQHDHPLRACLYVAGDTEMVRLSKGVVAMERDGAVQATVNLGRIEQMVVCGRTGLTMPLIHELSRRGIDLLLLDGHGSFMGRLARRHSGNPEVKRAQYRAADDEQVSTRLATAFVLAKLYNMRTAIHRESRRSGRAVQESAAVARGIESILKRARSSRTIAELMGHEGAASREYFHWMADTIPAEWGFVGRNRRPPRDAVNAMLSFGYTLLTNEVISSCEAAWLDPDLGYLHSSHWGRPSLALDLVEQWRPVIVDTVVLGVTRCPHVTPADFSTVEDGACRMSVSAKKAFIAAYEKRMLTAASSPAARGRRPYRELLSAHASSLARALLDSSPESYESYRWR